MYTEDQFRATVNSLTHREAWLHAVADRLRPIFASHGATIPDKIRLTCGFPSVRALSAKQQRLGECWSGAASKDGHVEIMISPVLDDPMRVAGVLAHELGHVCLGHLGVDRKLKIPSRTRGHHEQRELEAESVAYLICHRHGVQPKSQTYLSNFVSANTTIDHLDVYQVMWAAGQVEGLLGLSAHARPH